MFEQRHQAPQKTTSETIPEKVNNVPDKADMALQRIDQNHRSQQNDSDNLIRMKEMLEAVRYGHEKVLDTLEAVTKWSSSQVGSNRTRAQSENIRALTKREVQTVALLAEGLSKQKIADKLGIGRNTVCTHVRHIFKKLGVCNSSGAVGKAFRYGILKLDD